MIVGPGGAEHPGRWTVKESGSKEPVSTHRTQELAIQNAEKLARENQSELIVRGRDGQIRSKDSFGKDSNPPKDREH